MTLRKMRSSSADSIQRIRPGFGRGLTHSETAFVSRRKSIQKVYRLILRGGDLLRRTFSPDARSGDPAKNSARLPARLVFRCHSSAPTTIAAVRPLLVMVCGPSEMARSIISLNFDLASATVQLGAPTRAPFSATDHDSHYSH